MGMEMPDAVKWLLPIVVGESWPEGDEDKLRELRDAWHAASSALGPITTNGNQAAQEVLGTWHGDSADAFREQWKKFVEGDDAYFKSLAEATKALGDSCDQTALDVEYTKYMIIISLIILAAQIAAMIAAAVPSFGSSTAGIVPAQVATRMTVQMIFRQLLEKLAQQGFKQLAKELLEKFLKEGLKKIAKEVGKNVAMNVAMDAGIQGVQMAKGDRKEWDWGKTKDGAIGGAVDGVVGAASGGISHKMRGDEGFSVGGKVVQGAAEGAASTVGQAAVTGELGNMSASDVLMGASAGATSSGVDGAKEHFKGPEVHTPDGEPGGSGEPHGSGGSDDPAPSNSGGGSSEPHTTSEGGSSEPRNTSDGGGSSEPHTTSEGGSSQPHSTSDGGGSEPHSTSEGGSSQHHTTSEGGSSQPHTTSEGGSSQPHTTSEGGSSQPHTTSDGGASSAHTATDPGTQHSSGGSDPAPASTSHHATGAPEPPRPTPEPLAASNDHVAQQSAVAPPADTTGGQAPPPASGPVPSSPGQHNAVAADSGGQQAPVNSGTGQPAGGSPSGGYGAAPSTSAPHAPSSGGYGGGFGPSGGAPHHGGGQAPPTRQDGVTAAGFTPGFGQNRGEGGPPTTRPDGIPQTPQTPQQGPPPGGFSAPPPMQQGGGGGRPGGGPPPRQPGPPPGYDPRRGGYPQQGPPPGQHPQGQRGPGRQGPPQQGPPPGHPYPQQPGPPPQAFGPRPQGPPPPMRPQGPPPGPRPQGPPPQGPRAFDPRQGPPQQPRPGQMPDPRVGGWPSRPPEPGQAPGNRQHPGGQQPVDPRVRWSEQQPPRQEAPQTHEPTHEPSREPEQQPHQHHEPPQHGRVHAGEDYIGDHDFHTDRRQDFDALGETQLDTGLVNPHTGELRHEQVRREALALRDQHEALRHMSDDGAYAVHSYTRHEVFAELNEALRNGSDRLPELVGQARAIISGLNEMPPFVGETVRTVNHNGDMGQAALTAGHYEPGQIVVETQFNSSSRVTPEHPNSAFPGEVELRVQSRTGRDISDLASEQAEREVLYKPGTQLLVHSKELVTLPDGRQKWVIHAEEIAPGDPRHLDSDTARERMDERRERSAAEEPKHDSTKLLSALDPTATPEELAKMAESISDSAPPRTPPGHGEPEGGWSELNRTTNPPGAAAIHAGTAQTPQQQVRFLREHFPEIADVNARNFYAPDAMQNGFRTNCTRSVVAFEERMQGQHSHAEPLRPEDMASHGTLESIQRKLGGQWSSQQDFASAINEVGRQPVGSRAVLAYQYSVPADPNAPAGSPASQPRVFGHVVTAVHTEHGVAIIDPQRNRLASLPENPVSVDLLPYHRADTPTADLGHVADTAHTESPGEPMDVDSEPADRMDVDSDHDPMDVDSEHGDPMDVDSDQPSIGDRLGHGTTDLPEDYLFDPEHRATDADMNSVRDALGPNHDSVQAKALRLRDENPGLAHMSDHGATAVHGYTRGEFAYHANETHRIGESHEGFETGQHQVRAVVAGLNELPPHEGPVVRGIDCGGEPRIAELIAGHYEPGKITVEPTLLSSSIETDTAKHSKFGDDVELRIQSKTARDISGLADNPGEREALFKPGSQLLVHSKELVDLPGGGKKWVVHAEEIAPGDPRHLGADTAKQRMAERRARSAAEDPEIRSRRQNRLADLLGGPVEPEHTPEPKPAGPSIADRLDGAVEPPDHGYGAEPPRQHDWSPLARATNPPGEPAIHADTADPRQQANYVADRHPQLAAVNPHFHDQDAFANGYHTNCTRGVVAYAQRLLGIDAEADPVLPHEMATKGTLEYVQQQLGGQWQQHGDYDSVIREMNQQPVGSHAVVGVLYQGPNGQTFGHVAMVTHTPDGVAFIDPQSGSLMRLPHPPLKLDLLPFGSLEHSGGAAAPAKSTSDTSPSEAPKPRDPRLDYAMPADAQPSRIGPDGRPVPAFSQPIHHAGQHAGYGAAPEDHTHGEADQVRRYLDEDRVSEALDRAGSLGQEIRDRLPDHPALARMMSENGYLERSLLHNPKTILNLLRHPEAIPVLEGAVHDAHDTGTDTGPGGVEPTPRTPEQVEISDRVRESTEGYTDEDRRHPDFDDEQFDTEEEKAAYRSRYLDGLYDVWQDTQQQLNDVARQIAAENNGHEGYRTEPKDRARAEAKVAKYGGDVSKLTDLVGAKIEFNSVADIYRALDNLANDPRLEIVGFDDRFANPQASGYRDLQMSVRMPNGHIAELRLHLSHIDEVASYEHALYEVRRDFDTLKRDEGRTELTAEERALKDALARRTAELFQAALERGL